MVHYKTVKWTTMIHLGKQHEFAIKYPLLLFTLMFLYKSIRVVKNKCMKTQKMSFKTEGHYLVTLSKTHVYRLETINNRHNRQILFYENACDDIGHKLNNDNPMEDFFHNTYIF